MQIIPLILSFTVGMFPFAAHAFDVQECFDSALKTMFERPETAVEYVDSDFLVQQALGKKPSKFELRAGEEILWELFEEQAGSYIIEGSVRPGRPVPKRDTIMISGTLTIGGVGKFLGRQNFKVYIRADKCEMRGLYIGGFYSLTGRMAQKFEAQERKEHRR